MDKEKVEKCGCGKCDHGTMINTVDEYFASSASKVKDVVANEIYITPGSVMIHEKDFKFNAPHHFIVIKHTEDEEKKILGFQRINFQEGPIKEVGINGLTNEDLIVMVIERLEGFQNSEFACADNADALADAILFVRTI